MKHLPKHLRPRFRYLAVELESWPDAEIDREHFADALEEAARSLLGDTGTAAADIRLMQYRFDGGDGAAMVRVRRGQRTPVRAALACIDAIDSAPVRVHVRGVSGTVRSCDEKYMPELSESRATRVEFGDAIRPAVERGVRIDVETDGCFTGATGHDIG